MRVKLPAILFVSLVAVAVSCRDHRSEKEPVTIEDAMLSPNADTIHAALDSVISYHNGGPIITDLSLYNRPYELSIHGIPTGRADNDKRFRILLTSRGKAIVDTILVRENFSDGLGVGFLNKAGLYAVEFDFFRARSLYFKAYLGVDHSDVAYMIGFRIWYTGKNIGDLRYWILEDWAGTLGADDGLDE